MGMFESLEKAMCDELKEIEKKVTSQQKVTPADIECADKVAHALKSLATYRAMAEASEYDDGMSGYRGRAMNGRFVSRDGRDSGDSYADGYSRGYSEGRDQAMHQSGMMMPPYMDRYRY